MALSSENFINMLIVVEHLALKFSCSSFLNFCFENFPGNLIYTFIFLLFENSMFVSLEILILTQVNRLLIVKKKW